MPDPAPTTTAAPHPHPPPPHAESIRDTLISVIIAFTLAFVFRGFVIEAFVIPTGSMAPTLMGAHMRFHGPGTGYSWPVGPWDNPTNNEYSPVQNAPNRNPIVVHDPMSGEQISKKDVPLRSGDRILVLKYLYSVMEPRRFDVVVFKNPTDPSVNYIKRLIGLPGEEIALVDGDVFTRGGSTTYSPTPDDATKDLWQQSGWAIARKTRSQQLAVWQPVFNSSFTPLDQTGFNSPWNSDSKGWDFSGPDYTFAGAQTELFFDQTRRRFQGVAGRGPQKSDLWSIDDRYAYDETPGGNLWMGSAAFPVSDVRMRAGIEPKADGLHVEAQLRARGMDFQAVIDGAAATLRWRSRVGEVEVLGAWETLATAPIQPLAPGRVTDVEFCHVDQSIQLYIDGKFVIRHDYDWSPAERIAAATGMPIEQVFSQGASKINPLAAGEIYRKRAPDVRWIFSGGNGLTLHRVGLDRDLHYQPAIDGRRSAPALGTSPTEPLRLSANQFFCCGDNSPQSLDGRLWGDPEAWVAFEFDKAPGVVPRDLLLGKAFFVYWPAPHWNTIPIPDFGRMRFIR